MGNPKLFFAKVLNFNFSEKELISLLIVSQIIIYLILPDYLTNNQINITGGDAPSYIFFNFSNLKEIFSQHRTFGLPLIIKIYQFFSETLYFWPQVNYFIFCLSNIFLINALFKSKFNLLFSFFFVIGVVGSHNLYFYLNSWTELYSVSFIIFSLSFFLLSLNKKKYYLYILAAFFLFYSYQIRPSFIVYIFFFPTYILLKNLFLYKKLKLIFKDLIKVVFLSIIPFIVFIIIRFLITDHFGVTPFAGVNIAGHATHYLEEKDIKSLSKKNKIFAKSLFERKKKHVYPCNLGLDQIKENKLVSHDIKRKCFNIYVMSGWLEMIKVKKKLEPFPENDYRNFNSWTYVETLGIFFTESGNNNEVDKELSSFAWELILKNKNYREKYSKWFLYSFYESLYLQFYSLLNLIYLYIVVFFVFVLSKFNRIKKKIVVDHISEIKALIFSIIFVQFLSLFLTSMTNIPYIRALSTQSVFLVPSLMSFLVFYIFHEKSKNI